MQHQPDSHYRPSEKPANPFQEKSISELMQGLNISKANFNGATAKTNSEFFQTADGFCKQTVPSNKTATQKNSKSVKENVVIGAEVSKGSGGDEKSQSLNQE